MTEIKKIMERDEVEGIDKQIFPQTTVEAVLGLNEELLKLSLGIGEGAKYVFSKYQEVLNRAKKYTDDQTQAAISAATSSRIGGIVIGEKLSIDENGLLSANSQTDNNFTNEAKEKLDQLKILKAGANISISEDGTISAVSNSNSGTVVAGGKTALNGAEIYTDTQIASIVAQSNNLDIEEIGEVE